jgi:hypothetical protein
VSGSVMVCWPIQLKIRIQKLQQSKGYYGK